MASQTGIYKLLYSVGNLLKLFCPRAPAQTLLLKHFGSNTAAHKPLHPLILDPHVPAVFKFPAITPVYT